MVNIEVFTQNSIRIISEIGRIYIDPFQMKEEPKDADFILITHDHYDHFSPEDIEKISKPETVLVVPEKMKTKARNESGAIKRIETVKPGEHRHIDGLELEMIPSYNIMKPFHGKSAGWVGYIISVGKKRIYPGGILEADRDNGK